MVNGLNADIDLARRLFGDIRRLTADGDGVTRASYSREENLAHALARDSVTALGLPTTVDCAGNLYVTLEGEDRSAAPYVIGSHLDSVQCGGNFDGAAGVLAGLAIASAYRQASHKPPRDIIVMATRAEESMWFSHPYIGSRAALGLLDAKRVDDLRRSDTGRTLREHAAECGFDLSRLSSAPPVLPASRLGAFFEVHIEQGPVLQERGYPVGLVTGIRGNFRHRSARCIGEYGHCGTVPRHLRRDAVVGVAELIARLDELWLSYEEHGEDLAITVGVVQTDQRLHGVSKIAGQVCFALDVRSQSPQILLRIANDIARSIQQVSTRRGVAFDLGPRSEAPPASMDACLREQLAAAAQRLNVPYIELPSGAGHDAAMFAEAGVPTAMIFIRNEHGSHNPRESMTMEDFADAASILLEMLERGDMNQTMLHRTAD